METTATENETPSIPPEPILKKYQREVLCPLTDEEEKRYGMQLAEHTNQRRKLEDKKKQVTKEFGTEISKVQNSIARLADAIKNGEELRLTDVYEVFHNGVIEVRRQSDDVVVDSRAASLADRQMGFPGLDDDEDAGPDDPDDDSDDDEPEPVVMTPPGGAPKGEMVESSFHDHVYVTPDDEGDGTEAPTEPESEQEQESKPNSKASAASKRAAIAKGAKAKKPGAKRKR